MVKRASEWWIDNKNGLDLVSEQFLQNTVLQSHCFIVILVYLGNSTLSFEKPGLIFSRTSTKHDFKKVTYMETGLVI